MDIDHTIRLLVTVFDQFSKFNKKIITTNRNILTEKFVYAWFLYYSAAGILTEKKQNKKKKRNTK